MVQKGRFETGKVGLGGFSVNQGVQLSRGRIVVIGVCCLEKRFWFGESA
jgi:hypothetical protein